MNGFVEQWSLDFYCVCFRFIGKVLVPMVSVWFSVRWVPMLFSGETVKIEDWARAMHICGYFRSQIVPVLDYTQNPTLGSCDLEVSVKCKDHLVDSKRHQLSIWFGIMPSKFCVDYPVQRLSAVIIYNSTVEYCYFYVVFLFLDIVFLLVLFSFRWWSQLQKFGCLIFPLPIYTCFIVRYVL